MGGPAKGAEFYQRWLNRPLTRINMGSLRHYGLLYPAAQVVQQVDAGDQAEEVGAIHDNGDLATVEHRQQGLDRGFHVQAVQLTIAVATGSRKRASSP